MLTGRAWLQEAVKGIKQGAVLGVFAGVLGVLFTILLGHHSMRAWIQDALAQHAASEPGPQVRLDQPALPHRSCPCGCLLCALEGASPPVVASPARYWQAGRLLPRAPAATQHV